MLLGAWQRVKVKNLKPFVIIDRRIRFSYTLKDKSEFKTFSYELRIER